jgi:hypothetical protein
MPYNPYEIDHYPAFVILYDGMDVVMAISEHD